MHIDQQFIADVVNNFHNALSQRTDLCKACRDEFNVEFYKKRAYQELYGARYIPAYYFEYCVLANNLNRRLNGQYDHLNITSLGCGLSPDYYAFRDNLSGLQFKYVGYDCVEWTSKKHMPPVGSNYQFVFENIHNLTTEQLADTDVYVFPKSIGDIGENIVKVLAQKISKSNKNRIFFLNSYVTNEYKTSVDCSLFLAIHDELLDNGFVTNDDPSLTFFYPGEKGPGLRGIHNGFLYPSDKILLCNKVEANDEICATCLAAKQPIFTNKFMCYSLLEYQR